MPYIFPHTVSRPSRQTLLLPFLLALIALCLATNAQAHRVNVFAYVDGSTLKVEASFGGGAKVKNGLVEVRDAQSGKVLASTRTAEDGTALVEISESMRAANQGIVVLLNAGEGHQNTWPISREELGAGQASPNMSVHSHDSAASASRGDGSGNGKTAPSKADNAQMGTPSSGIVLQMSEEELARLIDARLEEKIAPLRHMLAESVAAGPKLSDVIGGLGWILGLFGVWALTRRRGS